MARIVVGQLYRRQIQKTCSRRISDISHTVEKITNTRIGAAVAVDQ